MNKQVSIELKKILKNINIKINRLDELDPLSTDYKLESYRLRVYILELFEQLDFYELENR